MAHGWSETAGELMQAISGCPMKQCPWGLQPGCLISAVHKTMTIIINQMEDSVHIMILFIPIQQMYLRSGIKQMLHPKL